jgi:NADPH-dependent 2,4-dienoyl-CoA reductase/sulfur reductase-like enzyme
MSGRILFSFDGALLEGRYGESLAAALTSADIREFRQTRSGAARGIFCGMGVCQDCLVEVDGRPNQRACMTKLDRPMTVRREIFGRVLSRVDISAEPKLLDDVPEEQVEILVIGGGPAGLSAAIAARLAGGRVTVVDERPIPGGQYFKQIAVEASSPPADPQHEEGARLVDKAHRLGVDIRSGVEIWGAFSRQELIGTEGGMVRRFNAERLIVATGAYERAVPVPGWTLPGVMTTGAAQTLWRSYRRIAGKRILLTGNGPLNMQVASELLSGGADIAAVVEIARMAAVPSLLSLLCMLGTVPRLVVEGLKYRAALRHVPIIYGSAVTRIDQAAGGQLAAYVSAYPCRPGEVDRMFEVDTVCLGHGFQPSSEILRALGCRHKFDDGRGQFIVVTDERGRTSVDGVFGIGDCTGLVGARASLAEGTIAGHAAALELGHRRSCPFEKSEARAKYELKRHRRFQKWLWSLYAAPHLGVQLATPDTLICRCEEISLRQIDEAISDGPLPIGDLKRATRVGMGPCQGRYCGMILSELVAKSHGAALDESMRFAPRMPVKPVAIADIARWPTA